ncbi:replication termination factor 2 isoform X2 [Thalassophryne amazonica]|uniref:replication termination factor 2 isoform X1 n=1 Tax=Thalassophryne amazonica TaxID=390379 RepID=UPI001471121E|nr:replication termination factor 2 isoform X1 [Thalassophryne amazonica]XP_034021957.1 replication termination factor 2 isoform X2 [Thalassophryne amazonica]
MGCDGGTIPKRHELVKGPKKVEKVDKNAELAAKWKYCALSQEKLRRPIVACELGRLYNKDAVIEYLLDKSAQRPNSEVVTHIRGIKDIKELNLTDNPEWEGERRNAKGDRYEDIHCGMFICPVVGLEMNGKHRFCYLQTCGCVFSDRALKEVKTEICHKCGDPFQDEDIVVLNGTKEEVEKLSEKMEEKRVKAKKSKKKKSAQSVFAPLDSQDERCSPQLNMGESSSLQNGTAGSKLAVAGPSGLCGSSKDTQSSEATTKKRSIQDMEEKSEAFKSLFTSHSSAKRTKEQMSNWVTHTPYHF